MISSISKIRPCAHNHWYKYASAKNGKDIKHISPHYFLDCDNKIWERSLYSLEETTNGGYELFSTHNKTSLEKFNTPLPSLKNGTRLFNWQYTTSFNTELPKLENGYMMFHSSMNMTNFDIPLPNLINGTAMFDITKLLTFDSDLVSLNSGGNMFKSSQLNKISTLRILNSIPSHTSGTHNLTIGIHIDHKYDPEVNLALKKCDNNYITPIEEYGSTLPEEIGVNKGWTLQVLWNGTATSDAYPPLQETNN